MSTRRQQKVARQIKELVSSVIARDLSDPRIESLVSVTEVKITPDLKTAEVYLSLFGGNQSVQNRTFLAIKHASSKIQSLVASQLHCKFSPVLRFHNDENFKKTLEVFRLIDAATGHEAGDEGVTEEG